MSIWAKPIEEDLKWREAELASLKALLTSQTPGSVRHAALLRSMVTLLYAHYEGFCKFAWTHYLDSVEKLALPRKRIKPSLAALSIQKELKDDLREANSDDFWKFVFSRLPSLLDEKAKFPVRPPQIANLWPEILQEWNLKLCLNVPAATTHEIQLKSLVDNRNQIAHGKKLVISSLATFTTLEKAASQAMYEVALEVVTALEQPGIRQNEVYTAIPHRA